MMIVNKEEIITLCYEAECDKLKKELNEQKDELQKRMDSINYEKNMIIESQLKEIEFYKNIIKSILDIK